MKRILAITTLLFMLLSHAVALASVTGVGSVYWAKKQNVTSTTGCVQRVGSATCALFPAGESPHHKKRVVVVDSSGPVNFCWSGDSALVFTSALSVTDASGPYGSGSGACSYLANTSGGLWQDMPSRRLMIAAQKSGTRLGLCPNLTTNEGESLYAPCDNLPDLVTDCASFGGGNCNLTPTDAQVDLAGVYLLTNVDSVTVNNVLFRKEIEKE